MLPTGIFVRIDLDDLILSLPGRLIASGPPRLTVVKKSEGSGIEEASVLELSQWSEEWCLIEVNGPEELNILVVQSVVRYEPMREVLSCRYRTDAGEFSYALFREGISMEAFESGGPSIGSVNFKSDLRRVPLKNMLRAADFMIESMRQFGIDPNLRSMAEVRKTEFHVKLPGKRTLWQTLLGAASPR
jgi:hypothetical protein